jgi:hypothetical protein
MIIAVATPTTIPAFAPADKVRLIDVVDRVVDVAKDTVDDIYRVELVTERVLIAVGEL